MRAFWVWLGYVCLILGLTLTMFVFLMVNLFPNTTDKYLRKIKKSVQTFFYPKKPTRYISFGVMMPDYKIHGIDVSVYQRNIDWKEVKNMKIGNDSLNFVFIKATEGTTYKDKAFAYNWEQAEKVGMLKGAYHYFKPDKDGKKQAEHFIKIAKLKKGDLPPVLDIEELGEENSLSELKKELKIFLNTLEKKYKVKPIIYSSRNFFDAHLGKDFTDYPLWVAQYKNISPPKLKTHTWTFWQHSAEAQINGIDVPVDLNVFKGEMQELMELRIKH
jgi:lysozyme